MKALNEKSDLLSLEKFEYYKNFAEKKSYELQNNFNLETNKRLKNFSSMNGIAYLERRKLFCNSELKSCDVFTKNGYRIRYDYGHLTLEGKKKFGFLLKKSEFKSILFEILESPNFSEKNYIPFLGVVTK